MPVTPAIQKYYDESTALLNKFGTDIDSLVGSLGKINADEQFLKETIRKLQESAGGVTPEDQGLIDQLQARITQLGGNLEAAKNVAAGLDAATEDPPTPPTP